MADVQVTCTIKTHHAHEGITHVGGSAGGGWCWPSEKVIDSIDAGTNTFYTYVDGRRANVGVVREQGKRPYLRTHADGYYNDNLLALPSCRG